MGNWLPQKIDAQSYINLPNRFFFLEKSRFKSKSYDSPKSPCPSEPLNQGKGRNGDLVFPHTHTSTQASKSTPTLARLSPSVLSPHDSSRLDITSGLWVPSCRSPSLLVYSYPSIAIKILGGLSMSKSFSKNKAWERAQNTAHTLY